MPIIVLCRLINTPTWFASFRELTLNCSVYLTLDVLLESEDVDSDHRWVKSRGGKEIGKVLVRSGKEDSRQLDIEAN